VQPDFEDQAILARQARFGVDLVQCGAGCGDAAQRFHRFCEHAHHPIANRLHRGAMLLCDGREDRAEVPANQFVGGRVAEAMVERGRAAQVREEDRQSLDAERLPLREQLAGDELVERRDVDQGQRWHSPQARVHTGTIAWVVAARGMQAADRFCD
jgi:hypothetical protein